MKKSTRIVLVILLCLLLIAISVRGNFSINGYTYDNAGRYTAGDAEITAKVEAIDLSWIAGKVTIARHDGESILLSESASRKLKTAEQLHWLLEGDTLYVKYVRSGARTSNSLDKELTLLLPGDMPLDSMQLAVVSADIRAELPPADALTVQSVSGAAEVALSKTATARITTVSGDVLLRCAAAPDSIDLESVSGNAAIHLPEDAGFEADLDSVSGKVSGSLLEGREGKGPFTAGDGACRIRMDSVSGDLRLDAYTR